MDEVSNRTAETSMIAPEVNPDPWHLQLYIAGRTPTASNALNNLKRVCERFISGQYIIEVIDLLDKSTGSSVGNLFVIPAIPVLVRKLPVPIRKTIGDLFRLGNVLVGLHFHSGMSNQNGFDLTKRLKTISGVPIIVFPVRDEDIKNNHDLQENDVGRYVTKQIKRQKIINRISTSPRNNNRRPIKQPIVLGSLVFDPKTFQLTSGDKEISLTRTEGLILEHLMLNPGTVMTHAGLARLVWGTYFPDVVQNLKVYIHRLREKIEEDPDQPKIIVTKSGFGYYIAKPNSDKISSVRKNRNT